MSHTSDIQWPPKHLCEGLAAIGSATASAELSRMGIRSAFIRGPGLGTPGACVAGPALTLQFLPKREDLYPVDEYAEPEKQLHRHVMYHTQPGDMVVVDARGDMGSGVFGEMMLTYFKGRGGVGVVIDGCLRDYPARPRSSASGCGSAAPPRTSTRRPTSSRSPSTCRWRAAARSSSRATSSSPTTTARSSCRSSWRRRCWRRRARTGMGGVLPHPARRGRRPAAVLPAVGRGPARVRGVEEARSSLSEAGEGD